MKTTYFLLDENEFKIVSISESEIPTLNLSIEMNFRKLISINSLNILHFNLMG